MDYSRIPLLPDYVYHIFNRGISEEKLFLKDENYRLFLDKYKKYILPVADTYCYCLMPNHFHLLIKIKSHNTVEALFKKSDKTERLISQQFSNLFNAYTKSFNKANNRRGSLFMKPFKRKQIKDDNYLRKVVHYIHFNPVKANLVSYPYEWKYSSYKALISQKETKIKKDEVINWFDDLENFKHCHTNLPEETGIDIFF